MGLKPSYRITADTIDITSAISDRFISLTLTDETGLASDMLQIKLADNDRNNPIALPRTGAELELWLGYDDNAQRMGIFVCDEVSLEGWPCVMTILARASPFAGTNEGKSQLQSQKSRSWPAGTKFSAMVAKIAKEHGMQPAISVSLAKIALPHLDQTEESDVSFLLRVAKRYDATVKPAGGKIMVSKTGELKTAGGKTLPQIKLSSNDCDNFSMSIARRDSPGTVIAYWHSKRAGHRQKVTVGSGEPARSIRYWFPTEEAAKAAAKAEFARRQRGEQSLSVSTIGNPLILAESPLLLTGFREGVDGDWLIRKVTHTLSKSAGYTCEIEAEKPDDTDSVTD